MNKMLMQLLARKYRSEAGEAGEDAGGDGFSEIVAEFESLDAEIDGTVEGDISIPTETQKDESQETSASTASAAAPTAPTPAVQPAPTATTAPQAATQQAQNSSETPAPASAPAPAPAADQPSQSAAETPSAGFDWDGWAKSSVEHYSKQYALTEEETQLMITEPEAVLPKMAANLHTNMIREVLTMLPQMLPQIIDTHLRTTETTKGLQEKFFSINSDLSDAKFANAIAQAGQFYRSLNPNADAETAAFQVGNMVRQAFGMPLITGASTAAPQAQQQPAASAPIQRMQPFNPAAGGPSAVADPPAPENPFTQLAREFEDY